VLWFWLVLRPFFTFLLFLGWWPRYRGIDNVPVRGPAVLASNHQSIADHFFTPLPLRRRIFFVAKSQNVGGKGVKGLIGRMFFTAVGAVPVDHTGGRGTEAALATGLRILGEGKLLGIYPEGTRAPDRRLYKGKTGVAWLALKARVPVVPVAVTGMSDVLPVGRRLPRLGTRPTVRFGEPLDFSQYYGREHDPAVRRQVTDEIMRAIQGLSGQQYVDAYAAHAKNQRAVEAA
jgi:1-acyl-sn-glycerol-3-phosphate acyltransferase